VWPWGSIRPKGAATATVAAAWHGLQLQSIGLGTRCHQQRRRCKPPHSSAHGGANIDGSASYSTTQLKTTFCTRVVTRRPTTSDLLLTKAEKGVPCRGQVAATARAHGHRVGVRSSYGPRSVEFEVDDTLKVTPNTGPHPLFLSCFLFSPLSHLIQLSPLLSVASVDADLDGDGVQAALGPEAPDLGPPHNHRCTGASGVRTLSSVIVLFAIFCFFQFVIEDVPL
jgi:hypothetical protein